MPTLTVNIEKITKTANRWRHVNGYLSKGGVIVLHKQEANWRVQGWVNELRNPESWIPGCIAITETGDAYIAQGGNQQDGAERWSPI